MVLMFVPLAVENTKILNKSGRRKSTPIFFTHNISKLETTKQKYPNRKELRTVIAVRFSLPFGLANESEAASKGRPSDEK